MRDSSSPAELHIVYPPRNATLTASDSTFIFGSVAPANARVTVNGTLARQARSGGWLAYVPIRPGDFVFLVDAEPPEGEGAPGERKWPVQVPGGFEPSWEGMLDSSSVSPRDSMELQPGDPLLVRFKGVQGLSAEAVLGDDLASSPFVEERVGEPNVGRRIFGEAEVARAPALLEAWSWYRAELTLPPPGGENGWGYGGSAELAVEVHLPGLAECDGGDCPRSLRYTLPHPVRLRDPVAVHVALLDDDPERSGRSDGRVVGRTAPEGVYALFLPNGSRAATGRRVGEFVELRLDDDLSVWAAEGDVHPLPGGTPGPRSLVPVVRTRRRGDWTRILVPLQEPLPVQVRQETDPARYEVTLFGATAATEFMRYDFGDPLVRELRWSQPARGRFVLEVELAQRQPWGFRYGYEGSDFYLDVRRAPRIRSGLFRSVLKGLRIVVDPGHSPDSGATGPTGYREKDANLAVALELAERLRREGADVILTRSEEAPPEGFGLNDRTNLAARREAHLLVSVHHNALPDGVNPFENNGTSTYYYHPQSLPLARAIQGELLDELGLPDFGIAHGNLALVRATEMPAVLTEAAFMMIPEQEELLRTPTFQKREARAIVRGIKRFLEESRKAERARGRRE